MVATFAFIGLFAIGSVDAIITGGADFAPGQAYAAEFRPTRVTPVAQPAAEILAAEEEAAAAEALKSAGEVDYSFTTEELLGAPEAELMAAQELVIPDFTFENLKSGSSAPLADVQVDDTAL